MVGLYDDAVEMLYQFAAILVESDYDDFVLFAKCVSQLLPQGKISACIANHAKTYPLKENSLLWVYALDECISATMNVKLRSIQEIQKNYTEIRVYQQDWSHPTWRTIHGLFFYNNRNKNNFSVMETFAKLLTVLLPCGMCRDHLTKKLAIFTFEDVYNGTLTPFDWTYILHNKVNIDTGKFAYPYSKAIAPYLKNSQYSSSISNKSVTLVR